MSELLKQIRADRRERRWASVLLVLLVLGLFGAQFASWRQRIVFGRRLERLEARNDALTHWQRQMDAYRDTVKANEETRQATLKALRGIEEGIGQLVQQGQPRPPSR